MDSSSHLASPAELQARIAAEREGRPFVVLRDAGGAQRIVALDPAAGSATVGRGEEAAIAIPWDRHVSSLHAELRLVAGSWLAIDDGVSRNGTFVNGERVAGRRRLADGDQIRVGRTTLVFRLPGASAGGSGATAVLEDDDGPPPLTPAQRRVLVALCRPFRDGAEFARPATNRQIADELFLSVPAVKTHLRELGRRFGVDGLPQNEKRATLARRALETGAVRPSEL